MFWTGFSFDGRGHDRGRGHDHDDDASIDRGHDLHGRGNGFGHSDDSSGGQPLLTVVSTTSTASGDPDPSIALITGAVADQAAYTIVGADADALQLVFDDDLTTDGLEFIVEVKDGSLTTAATGGDSFYDFQIAMDVGAADPVLSEEISVALSTFG